MYKDLKVVVMTLYFNLLPYIGCVYSSFSFQHDGSHAITKFLSKRSEVK